MLLKALYLTVIHGSVKILPGKPKRKKSPPEYIKQRVKFDACA